MGEVRARVGKTAPYWSVGVFVIQTGFKRVKWIGDYTKGEVTNVPIESELWR